MTIIKSIILILVIILAAAAGFVAGRKLDFPSTSQKDSPIEKIIERPLEKYSIENLSRATIKKSKINIGDEIPVQGRNPGYASFKYMQEINANLDGKSLNKVSGQINIPQGDGPFPIVVMFRGYVDPSIYSTGVGTRRAAEYFAQNGFLTIAPDFLGYADSDENAGDIMESRFQTYTTALSTLFSIDSLDQWDKRNVFLWGHSNGGQIALTLLEITGATFPTVLWAPVSKPFPYSVLYYTDEAQDGGKFLRREIAKFEDLYDTDKFSIHSYWGNIKAPIQLHQGSTDDAVPISWSTNLFSNLKKLNSDSQYYTYPSGDHNLQPGWDSAVTRSLEFYKRQLK